MNLELTNNEALSLLSEINDALLKIGKDGQPLKFNLTVLFSKVNTGLEPFNKLKGQFIKEKGTEDVNNPGMFTIKQLVSDTLPATDDNFTPEFKEYVELLQQKIDITFKPIPISYFEKLESESIYVILPKFVEL